MISTAITIVSILGAFVAGWYVASETIRHEVYTRRFDAYQRLVDSATRLVSASIWASADAKQYGEAMFAARLELMEEYSRQALHLSQDVANAIPPLYAATPVADLEKMKVAFNAMTHAMSHDLRLKAVTLTTNVLIPNARK